VANQLDPERARAIAAAKIAARYDVVCGGIDLEATLEALRARVEAARESDEPGERELADGIEGALAEAGIALNRTSEAFVLLFRTLMLPSDILGRTERH
jgi:hypothetical protein